MVTTTTQALDLAFARLAGELARRGRQPLKANPYVKGTPEHKAFTDGYVTPRTEELQ